MKRTLSLLFCFLMGAARTYAASCPSGLFIQAASLPAGGAGRAIAIAPIDSDAFPDLVVAQDQSLSVLLGHGDGTFDLPIVIPISGSGLYSVAVGDVDGDTKADLVVGSYGEVLVFIGHGDGTFDDPVFYFANGGPFNSVVLEHFDANASLDIALASTNLTGTLVMLGNGDGTFAPAVFYSTGASGGYLTSGDLDEDGHIDLAVTSGDSVAVVLGAGDGTFGSASHYLAGTSLEGLAAADLDGNGHLDLIATSDDFVSVLLGNGDGTFQAALQYDASLTGSQVTVADLDLDGILDVIVAGQSDFYGHSLGIAVLRGLGDGAFSEGEAYATGASSSGLAVGDLNGDGLPDVVTADPVGLAVSLLIDMPDGSLYGAPISSLPTPPVPDLFVQADFDEDGRQDFAWTQYSAVTTILGASHGRFRPGVQLADPFQQQILGIGAGIFSASRHTDLAITDFSAVWIFPGNGDGSFGAPVDVFDSSSLGTLEIADLNGDGKADIVFVGGCCPGGLNTLLGNGDGTFLPPVLTPLTSDARLRLAADLTGDGHTDLVASSSVGALLFPGNGDGSFASPEVLATGSDTFEAASGDFDSNGFADLLLTDSSGTVRLFLANGGGVLQPPLLIGVGGRATALAVADFDGDGKLDFAVHTGPVLVLLGLGNGHFQSPQSFPTNEDSVFIASGDYDGNGKPDLVSAGTQTLTTLLNAQLGATTPLSASFVVGSAAVLKATAGGGFGPLTYQWRKGGVPLADGGPISGSQTATLTIDPVAFTDAGSYDVVVADSCTNTTSNATTLSVEFDDVPLSNPFHDDIIAIATAGITTGCTDTSYCPSNPVSRAEMAVFLLKAKFGADHVPPPPPPVPIFPDVPADAFAAAWIDELATLQITAGCGDGSGNYCPDAPVTRGQMAVFLLKTLLGSGYVPPPPAGIFADVPADYFAIAWIEDLYNRGITAGCNTNPLRYCPDANVPREQMATFLARTFLGP